MKKTITFDLMGTLIHKESAVKKGLYPLMKKLDPKIDYPSLRKIYVKYSLGEMSQKEFWEIIPKELEKKLLDSFKLEKDAINTIEYLKNKQYCLGILSNFPKPWGDYIVKKYNLKKYFSPIIFSGEFDTRKPSKELYDIFLEKSKAKAEKCYFIDDKLANLKEAEFLEMKTIWKKIDDSESDFVPDFTIHKLSELKNIF